MVKTATINVQTGGGDDIIDITSEVRKAIGDSGITDGTVTVFVAGSTAGVTTIEYEPGVVSDLNSMFERIIPQNM